MINRRQFAATVGATALTSAMVGPGLRANPQLSADSTVRVDLPCGRVPLSFIIDDSTCLVNMGKYCMPQFAATYPDREGYKRPWRDWPNEIPDSFVREFGEWCAEQGVKGKYSVVPYPACVGWIDRVLPGWSQRDLRESIRLVQDLMLPNWDIHPEMISHTRVIDLKTGRPFADFSPAHMENTYPQEDISVDHLASYLAYALKILKNCDLPCEGITTPGGFGNRVKDKLPLAVFEAVRDVFGTEIPHYFKYIVSGDEDPAPRIEALRDNSTQTPELVMNVPAGTGDWFGGWDGAEQSQGEKYCNADATSGRMVELIERKQPAVMLCHWPGMYCGGGKQGFTDFQRVVVALNHRFGKQTMWMKVSEIGKYWAAKELTKISRNGDTLDIEAPFPCSNFTLALSGQHQRARLEPRGENSNEDPVVELAPVTKFEKLQSGTLHVGPETSHLCFELPRGVSRLQLS